MKTFLLAAAVIVLILPSTAQAAGAVKINLKTDCHTQSSYRTIVVPEGKKATRFHLFGSGYVAGEECGFEVVEDDPSTQLFNEAEEWRKKWDARTPPPYGWGIKSRVTGGYFFREFHQHRVRSATHGKLGSIWLGPGNYTVELRGYRKSSLSLAYWLEPYTPDGAKPAAAAPVATAPAAAGMVEKPHKPHGHGGTPAAKTELMAGPGVWGGVWYTHPGTITLTQTGNHVSGHYTLQSGKISGHIAGNTLVGKWSDAPTYKPPMDAGEAIYKMAPDGMSFTVDFRGGYGDNRMPWFRNAWKATRKP